MNITHRSGEGRRVNMGRIIFTILPWVSFETIIITRLHRCMCSMNVFGYI